MDVEEIQAQACKFSRVGNGSSNNKVVVQKGGGGGGGGGVVVEQYPDDEEDGGEIRRVGIVASTESGALARLRGWHHNSRIFRVSRASGGKDRHSKVLTSKGLRDRRVRLSVSTAIAFYDLQDRLGYDQPSKAVEWLIKAAEESIAELPSLNSPFPETPPKQLSDGKRESAEQGGFDSADVELDCEYPNYEQQHQHQHQRQLSLSKSACSSTSETSKGSGLSLSRSDVRENRVKARERARERAAKEKEKENESSIAHLPNTSSFTELLNAGISSVSNNNTSSTSASAQQSPGGGGGGDDGPSLFHKSAVRQWPTSTPMDYFTTGLLGSSRTGHQSNSGFSGQIQLGNSHLPQSMIIPPFAVAGDSHHHHNHHPPELQHFSFLPDHHLIPVAANQQQPGGGNENYNLNFTISSSGLAGFNRGTLQSNSSVPSMFPHLQRFSPIDGSSNVPFFIGGAAAAPSAVAAAAASPLENNNNNINNHHHHYHQFAPGLDGRLQLYHGDGTRHSDQKGKGKN